MSEILNSDPINVIARHAIHGACQDDGLIGWDMYPEIGEHDWLAIQAEIDRLTEMPPSDVFSAAYALLEARADHDA